MPETSAHPEILAHQIRRLEDALNRSEHQLLVDQPYQIEINGFRPDNYRDLDLPAAWGFRLYDLVPDKIDSIDCSLETPSSDGYPALHDLKVRWQNGLSWSIISSETGPMAIYQQDDRVIDAIDLHIDQVSELINQCQLSSELLRSGDIEGLLGRLAKRTDRIAMLRRRALPLHPQAEVELIHDAQLLKDADGQLDLVQELRLEAVHYRTVERVTSPSGVGAPSPQPVHANHLIFRQNPTANGWSYAGSYDGAIRLGDEPGEFHGDINNLTVPSLRFSQQIIDALNDAR